MLNMDLAVVMPMAGRGSRFSRHGIREPKPLIDLEGRPFFWWATESVRRAAPVKEMVFVVLDEHREQFAIDRRIAEFYPDARIVSIPEVTSGAAETAKLGVEAVRSRGPVAINDSDHAFRCLDLGAATAELGSSVAAGALLCFRSDSPAYSYVRLDSSGEVIGTVEKKVVSPFAIAGCYLFASAAIFNNLYESYRARCPYDELFTSGLFDLMAERGQRVLKIDVEHHCSFGTPEERERVGSPEFDCYLAWK
jgi:dTDP-glucose pyrophosphorylase